MPAGYVRVWLSMEEAIDRVIQAAQCGQQEARDAVVQAILDGEITSRFGDDGLQETKPFLWQDAKKWAPFSGFDARPPNRVKVSGDSAYLRPFFDPPPDPSLLPERMRPVEVRREDVERLWRLPGAVTLATDRPPDWGFWGHVPTATLPEAIALSLGIDPKRLRRPRARQMIEGRQFDEGPEFERRIELANRCLGDSLPGPVSFAVSAYEGADAVVRLKDFAVWARSVEWQIPPQLANVAAGRSERVNNTMRPDPNERLTLPEQVGLLTQVMPLEEAKARIDKAFRFQEITYQPHFAFPYDDAQINWDDGRAILRRLPRQPFTPTLSGAEFYRHFASVLTNAPQGTGAADNTLEMDEAIQRVGHSLYGEDWIGGLTERERWLIERYIDGSQRDRSSSIGSGAITYLIGGRRWAEVPGDPALMAEADRACDRRDWMQAQREAVCDWFENRGFNLDSDRIDKRRFETALAAPRKRSVAAGQPLHKASEISGPQAEPPTSVAAELTTHSGFPGRPGKAKHLIEDEFARRTKTGEVLLNLADEAAALLDWLKTAYPTVQRPTKATIENNIRGDHRRWKATTQQASPS